MSATIYTLGHSTHTSDAFLALLLKHDVTAVADVRSAPYSRFNPQFNKDVLARDLNSHAIQYVFLGRELGARPDDRACYEEGRVQFGRLAGTPLFKSGLDRVLRGAEGYKLALLCAEKEPLECHRTLLVGRALESMGAHVVHILEDGSLETNADALARLLGVFGLEQTDLFRNRQEIIQEACDRQEARIAYVESADPLSAERSR